MHKDHFTKQMHYLRTTKSNAGNLVPRGRDPSGLRQGSGGTAGQGERRLWERDCNAGGKIA